MGKNSSAAYVRGKTSTTDIGTQNIIHCNKLQEKGR
jgi:hypothetical protein